MKDTKNTLRVLSYNIRHGKGVDRHINLPRIAETIQSASPDIVALQEVDKNVRRSGTVDQAKELAALTGMDHVFAPSIRFGGGHYGNAALTNLPIKTSETIPLPGRESRSALCLRFEPPHDYLAEDVLFIATHLDLKRKARLASIPLIEQLLDSNKNSPAILAGDLNATPDSQTMETLEKNWKNTTKETGLVTFPAQKPKIKIDHILYRPFQAFNVLETRVLDEAEASDHRPILTVFSL